MRSVTPNVLYLEWKPRNPRPIDGGHHIRSYVLDRNLVKDLRTNVESTPDKVLNGELDEFIHAALLLCD